MSKRGENIHKRKDGRWECRYLTATENGKKYVYIYGKTYAEVKNKRLAYACGAQTKAVYSSTDRIIMAEIFDNWLDMERASLKRSTAANYSNIIEKHLKPEFGSISCDKLTADGINRYTCIRLNDGDNVLSPKYMHDILTVLKSAVRYASENYKCGCSVKDIAMPKLIKSNIDVLDVHEQKLLSEYLMKDSDCSKLGVMLCLHTGLRIGEICALKWENIDLKNGSIEVKNTVYRMKNIKGGGPKTILTVDTAKTAASVRMIPLNSFILTILKGMGTHMPDEYFLTGTKTLIEPRTYQYRFKKYLKEAGIERVNFHTLRHTFATNCVRAGCDVKSLSEILGHSSVKITLEKYVHTTLESKRNELEKLVPLY